MIEEKTVKSGPKDFFMHLLVFAVLYASIVSFLTLIFQYVNYLFPDPLEFFSTQIFNQIRVATSALVIIFPVFLLISWMIEKDFVKNPRKREMRFRKWLVYFTLFVAAVTIIVDLIILVNNFYSGDLKTQVLFKILAVLGVAAWVFSYYFWDLKRKAGDKSKKPKRVAYLVSVVVLSIIIAGFFIVGSPAEQRQKRFDEKRINDLQLLQNEIINYWIQKEKLPDNLSVLEDSISGFMVLKDPDPESNNSYEYNVIDELEFELCAVFNTENKQAGAPSRIVPKGFFDDTFQQNWSHEEGRTCFERTIDPDLYSRTPEPIRIER